VARAGEIWQTDRRLSCQWRVRHDQGRGGKGNRGRARCRSRSDDVTKTGGRRHHCNLLGAGIGRVDTQLATTRGETAAHQRLKRATLLWAQAQGFTACAIEVSLPRCRYRADVAGYRPNPNHGVTAIFECKQTRCDLRRDNCCSGPTRSRLETICRRRQVLEKHLRIHYPNLRICDSLFPEFDSHDFQAIGHRTYGRVLCELSALQNRLYDCTKFERLTRYGCANLFFLVVTAEVFDEAEIPVGWGALIETNETLTLARKPVWHEIGKQQSLSMLHRIATAGTRRLNRQLGITFEDVIETRANR
jgi:hypothetical protein